MTAEFEWVLLSTAVARMSELHPVYRRLVGLARRDLENMIRADRANLRGQRGRDPPEPITEPISHRHQLDLFHNTLGERRPGPRPFGDEVLFRGVEVEWIGAARYLRTHAVPALPAVATNSSREELGVKSEPEEVEKSAAEAVVTTSGKRERGPLPTKLEATTQAMRVRICDGSLSIDGLEKMLEKIMAETFGVSRDTCRKARQVVLSDQEFVEKYSRQTATNSDK
jgi:hypothetical protein